MSPPPPPPFPAPPEGFDGPELSSDGPSSGTQSEPLSTVPSGHVPGDSAGLSPPQPTAARPNTNAAPIATFCMRGIVDQGRAVRGR